MKNILIILSMIFCYQGIAQLSSIVVRGDGRIVNINPSTGDSTVMVKSADSTSYLTKYRGDTARNNLYALIATKQASGNYLTSNPNIGVATGTSLALTGAITSNGGGIGYASGNGGTVTQLTSKSTGQ